MQRQTELDPCSVKPQAEQRPRVCLVSLAKPWDSWQPGRGGPRWSPISIGDTINQPGPALTEEEQVENRLLGLQQTSLTHTHTRV